MAFFSRRNSAPPDRYRYDVPEKVRRRLLINLKQVCEQPHYLSRHIDFANLLHDVQQKALAKYGGLRLPGYEAAMIDGSPIISHFFYCKDEEVLDFLEFCFQVRDFAVQVEMAKTAVEQINRIFEEEGIGYELTEPRLVETGEEGMPLPGVRGGKALRQEFPRAIRKDERTVHEQAVKPALEALSDPRFATANSEFQKGLEEVRKGDYADAITSCGASFESVMRTICDIKKWPYDPNTATCSALVEVCRSNGLFPPFYAEPLKGVGTLRNKMGDAHGKGPAPENVAKREHAEHMVALTCTHITFLVRQAGI